MAARVFRCPSCDHRIRLGASRCGACWSDAPFLNRRTTWWGLIALVFAGLLFLTLSG